jgi:hypothetical protein
MSGAAHSESALFAVSEMSDGKAATSGHAQKSAFNISDGKVLNPPLVGQLYFSTRDDWEGDVPVDQQKLQTRFDETCTVIRARFWKRDPEKFEELFSTLLRMAHGAFASDNAQVAQGESSLDSFRNELIRSEGPAIKNEYLKELAVSAGVASIGLVCVGVLLRVLIHIGERYGLVATGQNEAVGRTETIGSSVQWDIHFSPMHFAFLLAATMWGIWLSFVVRNMNLAFEQLQHAEKDLMRPWSRLLAFGLLAFILALFFHLKILTISIGSVSTSQICDNVLIAIFVGLGLGFLDKTLPSEVHRRLSDFFQSAKTGSQSD